MLRYKRSNVNIIILSLLTLLPFRIKSFISPPRKIRTSNQLSSLAYQDERYTAVTRTRGSSLEQRLREMYKQNQKKSTEKRGVRVVDTLEEFKELLDKEGKESIVIVRFFANWCKACKATTPYYYNLANKHKSLCFVDVPITDKNVDLHQGLGIPSIPYAHIYIPGPKALLVEKFRMTKRCYKNHKVESLLNWYVNGFCPLKIDDELGVYCASPEFCMVDDDEENYTKL